MTLLRWKSRGKVRLLKAAAERQIAEKRAVQEQEAAEKIRKKETERLRREEMEASNPSATAGSNLTKFVLIGIAVGVALLAVWLVTHNTPEDFKAEKLEQMRIDSIAMEESWKSTFVEGKLPGFRKFLDQYPNSKYAGDARKTITYLENELKKILQSTDGFIEAKMKKEASDKLQKAAEISPGDNAIVKRLEAIKGME